MVKRMIQQRMLGSLRSSKNVQNNSEFNIEDLEEFYHFPTTFANNNQNKLLHTTQRSIIYTFCKHYAIKYSTMLRIRNVI